MCQRDVEQNVPGAHTQVLECGVGAGAAGVAFVGRSWGCPVPDTASSGQLQWTPRGHSSAPQLSWWHSWESTFKQGQNAAQRLWERGERKNLREQALQIPKWEKNVEEEMLQVCEHRLPCNLRWDHTDLTWRTVFPGRNSILEQGRKVRRDKGEQLQADHNSHSPSPCASWEGCQWRCEVEPREKGGRLKVLF